MPTIQSILLVDDEPMDHIIAKHTIAAFDPAIAVASVYDGNEALEWIKGAAAPPDLILLDINMPGMNGHEFLSVYATWQTRSSVVVMLTSSEQEHDRRKATAFEFVEDVLTKPLEEDDLIRIEQRLKQ